VIKKIFFLTLLGIGIFVAMQVAMPYLSYKAWERKTFDQNSLLVSPSANVLESDSKVLGVSIQNVGNFPSFVVEATSSATAYDHFLISIPSIKVLNTKVVVNTNDFSENLAHLPGTALPGEVGNVFVTGHSSLPQIKNTKNMLSFANLPKMKKEDSIFLQVGGQRYEYIVEGLRIVDPKEVWVIDPPDKQGRFLSLMTCVPPGFNTKRLIVLARLKGT